MTTATDRRGGDGRGRSMSRNRHPELNIARKIALGAISAERKMKLHTNKGITRLLVGRKEVDRRRDSDAPDRKMWWNIFLLERDALIIVAFDELAELAARQRGYEKGLRKLNLQEAVNTANDALQEFIDAAVRREDIKDWGWISRMAERFGVAPSTISRRVKHAKTRSAK